MIRRANSGSTAAADSADLRHAAEGTEQCLYECPLAGPPGTLVVESEALTVNSALPGLVIRGELERGAREI